MHGPAPTSVDAGIYGFIANIYFCDIDTPLKQFVCARQNLERHCTAIHDAVMRGWPNDNLCGRTGDRAAYPSAAILAAATTRLFSAAARWASAAMRSSPSSR